MQRNIKTEFSKFEKYKDAIPHSVASGDPAFLFLLRTVLLLVPSVVAAVFQPTEVCEYQILSTYDVTTGSIDFTVFLNYLLILNCQSRLLNLIIGGMNGSLQICNMIFEFFVV